MPLAVSARCFTARYNTLTKDDCGFRCIEHPDGLTVSTQDDEAFLVMNGLQTQSARVYNLIDEVEQIITMGVSHIRVSPQSSQTAEVVAMFHDKALAAIGNDAVTKLMPWAPDIACNGYWHGRPGMDSVVASAAGKATIAMTSET